MANQVHFFYDQNQDRAFAYRTEPADEGRAVRAEVAVTYRHPNDNDDRRIARSVLVNRLNAIDNPRNEGKVMETFVAMPSPETARQYRELEETIKHQVDLKLPTPAARQ